MDKPLLEIKIEEKTLDTLKRVSSSLRLVQANLLTQKICDQMNSEYFRKLNRIFSTEFKDILGERKEPQQKKERKKEPSSSKERED